MWQTQSITNGFIIITKFGDEKEKANIVNWIRFLFVKEAVQEYCFMFESWFKEVEKLEDRPKGLICDLPDKREALSVIYCRVENNGKIQNKLAMFEMIRRDEKIELLERANQTNLTGAFVELLSPLFPFNDKIRKEMGYILEEMEKRFNIGTERIDL